MPEFIHLFLHTTVKKELEKYIANMTSKSVLFCQESSLSALFPHQCKKCFVTDFTKSVE